MIQIIATMYKKHLMACALHIHTFTYMYMVGVPIFTDKVFSLFHPYCLNPSTARFRAQ